MFSAGFPDSSAGKEYACNAGDLGWISGLGRFPREGHTTASSVLAWRIPMDGGGNQTERLNNLDRKTKHSTAQLLWRPEPLHICQQE